MSDGSVPQSAARSFIRFLSEPEARAKWLAARLDRWPTTSPPACSNHRFGTTFSLRPCRPPVRSPKQRYCNRSKRRN